jgi:hypothetical protein
MQAAALGEALDGRNFLLGNITHVGNAGSPRLAIDQNSTRTALAFAAAVLAARQIEMISQYHQQTGICLRIDVVGMSIDIELPSCCHPENLSERAEVWASMTRKPALD